MLHANQHLFKEKKPKCSVTLHWVRKKQVHWSSLKVNFYELTQASLHTFTPQSKSQNTANYIRSFKHGINPFYPFWCKESMHISQLDPYWCWKWSTYILRDRQADPQTRWKSNDLCGRTVAATHKCTERQMDRQINCHTQKQGERQIDKRQTTKNQQYI